MTARTIDLNGDGASEYLVEGQDLGKCISGNKFHAIWVYRKVKTGFQMILGSSSTRVSVLKTSSNGYKDIREVSVDGHTTYTTTYKFDGDKYQPNR